VQYHVGLLCRRLYGKHVAKRARHLERRLAELKAGKFDTELDGLCRMDLANLKKLYDSRDIEPEDSQDPVESAAGAPDEVND
jgi:hypothetical protein